MEGGEGTEDSAELLTDLRFVSASWRLLSDLLELSRLLLVVAAEIYCVWTEREREEEGLP